MINAQLSGTQKRHNAYDFANEALLCPIDAEFLKNLEEIHVEILNEELQLLSKN
jgi:hypothetical protein